MYVYIYVCVCMYVRACMYVHVCVCMYVCVEKNLYVYDGVREIPRDIDREAKRS